MLYCVSVIGTDLRFSFSCFKSLAEIINDKMFIHKHHIAGLCLAGFVKYVFFEGGGGKFLFL